MFASVATSTMTIRHVQSEGTFTRLVSALRLGLAAHRQRAALRAMDDARLADIGLTIEDAEAEANRAFWDVPSHWRR